MKLTIEGKPDEIKDLFGDAVMTKNVNNYFENKKPSKNRRQK